MNADLNIAALQAYTFKLLTEVEAESGQNIGMHMTGGISFASAPESWEGLQSAYPISQTMGITLLEAESDFGISEIGFNAANSLRLVKSFGIWFREFTQEYTTGMTGRDRRIALEKGEFIGREAAIKEQESGGAQRVLATVRTEAADADAAGYEPLWKNEKLVGYVTSEGFGHTIDKSIAMVMLDRDLAREGTDLKNHIVGQEHAARVVAGSPYNPSGEAMRA